MPAQSTMGPELFAPREPAQRLLAARAKELGGQAVFLKESRLGVDCGLARSTNG